MEGRKKQPSTCFAHGGGKKHQIRPEGRNRRGETRLRGPEVVSETPSQRPLRAPERLSGPRGRLFRGLGEACPFSTERGKKVGHSEAPERPRFPGCPLRGLQPSGSYLRPQIKTPKSLLNPPKGLQNVFPGLPARSVGKVLKS